MKKLELKKKVVSVLTDKQMQSIEGGGTTSYSRCTDFTCCAQQPCVPASEGTGNTCLMQPGCTTTDPPMVSSLGQNKCMCIN
jgi:bacteriocin-like protein